MFFGSDHTDVSSSELVTMRSRREHHVHRLVNTEKMMCTCVECLNDMTLLAEIGIDKHSLPAQGFGHVRNA